MRVRSNGSDEEATHQEFLAFTLEDVEESFEQIELVSY
jgi:cleavage and polyadenylation specificity factor subunit 2